MKKKFCIQCLCILLFVLALVPNLVACKLTIETEDMPQIVLPPSTPPEDTDNSQEDSSEQLPPNNNSSSNNTPPIQEDSKPNDKPDAPNNSNGNTNTSPQPSVQNDVYVRSITNGLNVRSAPSTNSKILGTLDANDMVLFMEKQEGWYKTVYKNQTAYVSASSKYTNVFSLPRSGNATLEKVIAQGYRRLGYEYVYGATRLHNGKGVFLKGFKDTEFDCSSLMQYIFYYGSNILLDVTTRTQVVQGQHVDKEKVKRGDLLFYTNAKRINNVGTEKIGHVALYLGNNYILHTSSDHAVIEPMSKTRQSYLIEGRRFL